MTAIYYTSNCEDELFESKIRQALVKNCDLPIISVSQKPIDLGVNICVGEHKVSVYNSKKQIYEGLKMAKTRFIYIAEADFLYPKEYFEFEPEEDTFYCMKHVFILWKGRDMFFRKYGSEGSMVCHREKLMDYMETYLTDNWDESRPAKMKSILFHPDKKWWWLDTPAITFKTGNGMHEKCPYFRRKLASELPHWGSIERVKNEFL